MTIKDLIVGETYEHIKYKWTIKILFVGSSRVFAFKYGDNIESSWEIKLLLKEFVQI